jgi:hypothetical protein
VLTGEGREGERRERPGGTRGAVGGGGALGGPSMEGSSTGLLLCSVSLATVREKKGGRRREEREKKRRREGKGREKEKEKEFFSKLGNF